MKKILVVLLVLFATNVFAQQREKKTVELLAFEKKALRQALDYNDGPTAAAHLNRLIVLGQEQYKDSLAILYFAMGSYRQCEQVCLELDNTDPAVMQMLAYSQKAAGKTVAAIESFRVLTAKTQNKVHAYELANLQLQLQKFVDFDNTLTTAKDWKQGKDAKVYLQTDAQTGQQVPVDVALLHLSALNEATQNNFESSVQIYEEALALFPEFELAKRNIEVIRKQINE